MQAMPKKPFRLITLLGIRPDLIRMYKLIKLLDRGQKEFKYEHLFMHTGQHYSKELDEVFYRELGIRKPDFNLGIGKTLKERGGPTTHAYQTSLLFERMEEMLQKYKPDAVMYLGDTNSVTSSFIAARAKVPVIHLEAGGRSFDWRMPEEKCRILIDHMSDLLYAYMPRHRENLLQEGVSSDRIVVIGNIIYDAVEQFLPKADKTKILQELQLKPKSYCAVTLHREENTDDRISLTNKVMGFVKLSRKMPIIWPVMPRVSANLKRFGLWSKIRKSKIRTVAPLGFFEFLKLEKEAKLIVSDSGTVQEEAMILGVPALITRLSTERPETIFAGATILSNEDVYENALKALRLKKDWDRYTLNPMKTSPSDLVFADLTKRITSGYFARSRTFKAVQTNPLVREAYGYAEQDEVA